MGETLFYLVSSFWLGAVHAATPGHGKTIAAAYIVGARGKPIDAVILGIFVTLSHVSGIVLVALLATMGSSWAMPQRVEAYLALFSGILVIAIGLWMIRTQRSISQLPIPANATPDASVREPVHTHLHTHEHAHSDSHPNPHTHEHTPGAAHAHAHETAGYHSHGWGIVHTHRVDLVTDQRPKMAVLLGLGIAGGLLPDPGALAILLAALAKGDVILGLLTVLVFSIGFAATLVVVGLIAAKVGQVIWTWLSGPWVYRVQIATALLIVAVGIGLTWTGWRTLASLM